MVNIVKEAVWPVVLLLTVLSFMLLFRTQLAALISRITSIDKSGVKTSPAPESQREQQKTEAVQELLSSIGDSIVLRDIEGRIKSFLKDLGLAIEGDTIKVLIKHLAATQILLEFEQVHNLIFGSQIFLMKRLNEVTGQGQSKAMVVAHFEHVRQMFRPDLDSWSFDQYMTFLLAKSLVTVTRDVYHITNIGVEYLTWMARTGRSENRPL